MTEIEETQENYLFERKPGNFTTGNWHRTSSVSQIARLVTFVPRVTCHSSMASQDQKDNNGAPSAAGYTTI